MLLVFPYFLQRKKNNFSQACINGISNKLNITNNQAFFWFLSHCLYLLTQFSTLFCACSQNFYRLTFVASKASLQHTLNADRRVKLNNALVLTKKLIFGCKVSPQSCNTHAPSHQQKPLAAISTFEFNITQYNFNNKLLNSNQQCSSTFWGIHTNCFLCETIGVVHFTQPQCPCLLTHFRHFGSVYDDFDKILFLSIILKQAAKQSNSALYKCYDFEKKHVYFLFIWICIYFLKHIKKTKRHDFFFKGRWNIYLWVGVC